jgi:hypothetical protein
MQPGTFVALLRSALSSTLVCLLLAAPLSGCFVMDELDKADALIDAHSPNREARKTAARQKENGKKADGAPLTLQERKAEAQKWWDSATTVTSRADSSDNPMVHCRTGGSTLFMRRADCLARGGQPGH